MHVLKNISAKLQNTAQKFDQDQDGMETMQIVMIIAVAAIVMLFIKNQWESISGWADSLLNQITSWQG